MKRIAIFTGLITLLLVGGVYLYLSQPEFQVGFSLSSQRFPNLYALLSPQSEQPDKFWTGSKEVDPVKVGHDTSELKGGYLYDVAKPGNSNHATSSKMAQRKRCDWPGPLP